MDLHTEDVLEFRKIREAIAEHATCALGRERLFERAVATDAETIEREYAFLAELHGLMERDRHPPIDGLLDLRAVWRQVKPYNAVLEPAQLLEAADFCAVVARVRRFFAQEQEAAPRLAEESNRLILLHHVEYHIRQAIDPGGEVADHASPRLCELRGEIRSLEGRIQHTLERLVRQLEEDNILQDDFITQRQGRYVLPVKAGQKGRIKGIVHDASHSGETFFIEPFAVVETTNELTERRVEAREEIRKILIGLGDHVRSEIEAIELNTALTAELDERVARARFGAAHEWVIPGRSPGRPLKLVSAHHPLLLLQSPATSVPLDLPLGADDRALIVSGPNAGGKTTALKTVGLLTLMFQSSMPLPVDAASNFRVFERVLADIGDEQDVTMGISTFSSHVRRIADMFRRADAQTLVLLDELGTATDPTEGGALAVAVVESLVEKDSLILVTSHLALLKSWAEQHDRARNASFHLDPNTQRPSYRMRLDVPGVSEALIIAEQQGLDRRVVERARALLPEGVYDLNRVLLRLEAREQQLAEDLARAARRETEAGALKSHIEAEREDVQAQQRGLKKKFLEEKEAWLRDVRQRIERRIAELPSREDILDAKRQVQALQDEVRAEQERLHRDAPFAAATLERLAPGRRVRVETLHEDGEVVAVDADKQRVTVAIRNVQVELTPDQVAVLNAKAPADLPRAARGGRPASGYAPGQLDLHGLRVEQAVEELDRYIDLALRNDLETVRIRHGRGTGALRRATHEFLREHKSVRSFSLAEASDGGDAVTIVVLK